MAWTGLKSIKNRPEGKTKARDLMGAKWENGRLGRPMGWNENGTTAQSHRSLILRNGVYSPACSPGNPDSKPDDNMVLTSYQAEELQKFCARNKTPSPKDIADLAQKLQMGFIDFAKSLTDEFARQKASKVIAQAQDEARAQIEAHAQVEAQSLAQLVSQAQAQQYGNTQCGALPQEPVTENMVIAKIPLEEVRARIDILLGADEMDRFENQLQAMAQKLKWTKEKTDANIDKCFRHRLRYYKEYQKLLRERKEAGKLASDRSKDMGQAQLEAEVQEETRHAAQASAQKLANSEATPLQAHVQIKQAEIQSNGQSTGRVQAQPSKPSENQAYLFGGFLPVVIRNSLNKTLSQEQKLNLAAQIEKILKDYHANQEQQAQSQAQSLTQAKNHQDCSTQNRVLPLGQALEAMVIGEIPLKKVRAILNILPGADGMDRFETQLRTTAQQLKWTEEKTDAEIDKCLRHCLQNDKYHLLRELREQKEAEKLGNPFQLQAETHSNYQSSDRVQAQPFKSSENQADPLERIHPVVFRNYLNKTLDQEQKLNLAAQIEKKVQEYHANQEQQQAQKMPESDQVKTVQDEAQEEETKMEHSKMSLKMSDLQKLADAQGKMWAKCHLRERDNAQLQKENQELEVEKAQLESKIKHLEEVLQANEAQIEDLKDKEECEIAQMKSKVLDFQNTLGGYEAQIKKLKAQNEAQTQANLTYQTQIERFEVQIKAQQESEVAQTKSDYEAQIEALKTENEALKQANLAQTQSLKAQSEVQNQAKLAYQAQIEGLKVRFEAQIDSERAQVKYEAHIKSLKAENEVQKQTNLAEIQAHRVEKEELKREIEGLRETWKVSGTLVNTLMQEAVEMRRSQQTMKALQDELYKMKLAEKEPNENYKSLQNDLDRTKALNLNYKSQLEEMSKEHLLEVQGKDKKLAEMKEEMRKLEEKLNEEDTRHQTVSEYGSCYHVNVDDGGLNYEDYADFDDY